MCSCGGWYQKSEELNIIYWFITGECVFFVCIFILFFVFVRCRREKKDVVIDWWRPICTMYLYSQRGVVWNEKSHHIEASSSWRVLWVERERALTVWVVLRVPVYSAVFCVSSRWCRHFFYFIFHFYFFRCFCCCACVFFVSDRELYTFIYCNSSGVPGGLQGIAPTVMMMMMTMIVIVLQ